VCVLLLYLLCFPLSLCRERGVEREGGEGERERETGERVDRADELVAGEGEGEG
jgi:hypothetical protein